MDPCCGSGHFLVAAFEMLRRMRMEEEGLSQAAAAAAVLRDNLFGLELDARCTQIAAFALALAAWRAGGYRPLPALNLACSGIPVAGQLQDWLRLAGDDGRLRSALERLYSLFKNAPDLGSLINPADLPLSERMFTADYEQAAPLLEQALAKERGAEDPAAAVLGTAAEGVARAARLLAGKYTLVATNVPYLTRGKQGNSLRLFCDQHYKLTKADLANCFLDRSLAFCTPNGSVSIVTPQNWLFQPNSKKLREHFLKSFEWNFVGKLGAGAFDTIGGAVVNVALIIITVSNPGADHKLAGIDTNHLSSSTEKEELLRLSSLTKVTQLDQLYNPDARITIGINSSKPLLREFMESRYGLRTGDFARFGRMFWELSSLTDSWSFTQSTVPCTLHFGGREHVFLWENGKGELRKYADIGIASFQGMDAWGKKGVAVNLMTSLFCSLYNGNIFDNNIAIIWPKEEKHLEALWAFCQSPHFSSEVRKIDHSLKVMNQTLLKVPFDLEYWQKVAEAADPLPEPHSDDPTQWLFEGRPAGSTAPLQVAAARLLGYRWPQQKADGLSAWSDEDGIACLPSVHGEPPAAERLRSLLAAAYGTEWSGARQDELLAAVGYAGQDLAAWLREAFFEQHCRLFHNRPFIWHIWDGRKDGFSALVNYHRLDRATLEKLTYTYLGAWITACRQELGGGSGGAEGRLVAALALQEKLKLILEGEPPYDIYVRWKAMHQQPLGWEPDLNDGVRLNIRPFVTAGVLRSKFTINWSKDRGMNPDGTERLNDLHLSLEEKRAARQAAGRDGA